MEHEYTNPVLRAAEIVGGVSQLATECQVTPQAVYKWTLTKAPANRCIQIEVATKGEVTRYELRPDVFGEEKRRKMRRATDRGRRENP